MKGYAKPNAARAIGSASTSSIREALESKAAGLRADDVARWLANANDDEFLELVAREVRGGFPAEVADVFGHPLVCDRWNQALKTLQMQAAGHKGIASHLAALTERRTRAVHAITQANADQYRKRLTTGKRHTPRNRAIDRLIDAHPEEFERLVREELSKSDA